MDNMKAQLQVSIVAAAKEADSALQEASSELEAKLDEAQANDVAARKELEQKSDMKFSALGSKLAQVEKKLQADMVAGLQAQSAAVKASEGRTTTMLKELTSMMNNKIVEVAKASEAKHGAAAAHRSVIVQSVTSAREYTSTKSSEIQAWATGEFEAHDDEHKEDVDALTASIAAARREAMEAASALDKKVETNNKSAASWCARLDKKRQELGTTLNAKIDANDQASTAAREEGFRAAAEARAADAKSDAEARTALQAQLTAQIEATSTARAEIVKNMGEMNTRLSGSIESNAKSSKDARATLEATLTNSAAASKKELQAGIAGVQASASKAASQLAVAVKATATQAAAATSVLGSKLHADLAALEKVTTDAAAELERRLTSNAAQTEKELKAGLAALGAGATAFAAKTDTAQRGLAKSVVDAKTAIGAQLQGVNKALTAKIDTELKSMQIAMLQMKQALSTDDNALGGRIDVRPLQRPLACPP